MVRRSFLGGRGPRVAGAVIALAGLLAACGSYTKRDFVASADAICASAVRQTRAIPAPSSQQISAVAPYLAKLTPILASEERQLRALRRPSGSARDRAALSRYLAAETQFVSSFKALAAAAQTGSRQALGSAEGVLRSTQVDSLATSYGLRSCGTPGATVG
jgi:hypothetical protein